MLIYWTAGFWAATAFGAEINVGKGGKYKSIQLALSQAASGDTLILSESKFKECLELNGKSLTIDGKGKAIIDGEGRCDFLIKADGGEELTLKNLNLQKLID